MPPAIMPLRMSCSRTTIPLRIIGNEELKSKLLANHHVCLVSYRFQFHWLYCVAVYVKFYFHYSHLMFYEGPVYDFEEYKVFCSITILVKAYGSTYSTVSRHAIEIGFYPVRIVSCLCY